MPNLLKNLHLEELSLVDRPANAQAMVSLFKRDNSEEEVTKMTEEMEAKVKAYMEEKGCGRSEAMKSFGYDEAEKAEEAPAEEVEVEETAKAEEVNPLEAEVEALKAEIEELNKSASLEKADDKIEVSGEMVSKSDIPAPVLKALEAAAIEKADIALTKRAEEALPHFDLAVAKSLVEKFSESEEIMVALKAADSAFEASMQEFGKSDVDGEFASSQDKLDALVKSYMDDNQLKKSGYFKAYAEVAKTDEGKSLINKTYKGE
ncbi:MAG: hypothetical protein P8P29_08785 [Flavobacteriaceae bacterium]|nr:hypothetical protein [Flavobacteriaceae bacterium]